jgi:hypothetical protein
LACIVGFESDMADFRAFFASIDAPDAAPRSPGGKWVAEAPDRRATFIVLDFVSIYAHLHPIF